jgi:hypothetical protein
MLKINIKIIYVTSISVLKYLRMFMQISTLGLRAKFIQHFYMLRKFINDFSPISHFKL